MLIFFAFDNDDMKASKRRVTFLPLIFLLKYMLKVPEKRITCASKYLWSGVSHKPGNAFTKTRRNTLLE